MRRSLLLLLAAAALLLSLAGVAQAGSGTITWDPTAGSGGTKASGTGGCTQQPCGGGGGGAIWWFDLNGLQDDNTGSQHGSVITWPEGTMDADRNCILKITESCSTPTAQKAANELSASSTFEDVIWYNACYDGATATYKTGVTGCSANYSGFSHWDEIHSANPDATGTPPVLNELVAWNIQIWREKYATSGTTTSKPIFERRVGLKPGATNDDDSASIGSDSNRKWWYGGTYTDANLSGCDYSNTGGEFSGCGNAAGPLGTMTDADQLRCQSHVSSAKASLKSGRLFTGITDVYSRGGYSYADGALPANGKLGNNTCYWGIGGVNTGEAIRVHWTVDASSGSGTISYVLQGKPGYFYAVHITAIDSREQLMKPAGNNSVLRGQNNNNYFLVFMSNGHLRPCKNGEPGCTGPPDCIPGLDYDPKNGCPCPAPNHPCPTNKTPTTQSNPVVPIVDLESPNPVPSRTWDDVSVNVNAPQINPDQAFFPELVDLLHFTPQMRYNGSGRVAGGSTYSNDYVNYDSSPTYQWASSLFGSATPIPLKAADLTQPANIDAQEASLNDFGINWFRPTLQNPCSQAVQQDNSGPVSEQGTWLSSGQANSCSQSAVPRNIWDDYLQASVIYETRWVDQSSPDGPASWLSTQTLRCANTVDSQPIPVSGCNSSNAFMPYSGTIPNTFGAANDTQHAEGYIRSTPSQDEIAHHVDAAAHFHVNNSRTSIVDADLYNRDSGQDINGDGTPYVERTIQQTGHPQDLWFCTNSVPSGALIDLGPRFSGTDSHGNPITYSLSGDDQTSNTVDTEQTFSNGSNNDYYYRVLADQECHGYASKWQWDGYDSSWHADWGNCYYNIGTPPRASKYPIPNDNGYSVPEGKYSEFDSWKISNSIDFRPLLDGWTAGAGSFTAASVPYEGSRPGRPGTDGGSIQAKGCSKSFNGHYYSGGWSAPTFQTVVLVPGFTITIPGTPSYTYQQCTYKTVKGKLKKTCKTITVPATPPTYIVVPPITEQVPHYTWDWNGQCYPDGPSGLTQTGSRVTYSHYINSPGDTTYTGNVPSVDGVPGVEDGNAFGSNWSCSSTVGAGSSFVVSGQWVESTSNAFTPHDAGGGLNGWGKNDNGPNLPDGQWVPDWTFSGITPGNCPGNSCTWSMNASYYGPPWHWVSWTRRYPHGSGSSSSELYTDNPQAAKVISVYASRTTR